MFHMIFRVFLMLAVAWVLVLITDWHYRRKGMFAPSPRCYCGNFNFTGARRYFLVRGLLHTPRLCAPEQEMIWSRQKDQQQ